MNTVHIIKRKSSLFGLASLIFVGIIFVGARQLHPGGIRGIVGDFIIDSSTNPEIKALHDRVLTYLVPIGAAAICIKRYGENKDLIDSITGYNSRNEAAVENIMDSIKAAGGATRSEKDLLDREAYRKASNLVKYGHSPIDFCNNLASRINSGEFDVISN